MITNEKQYKTAKAQVDSFQSSLNDFSSNVEIQKTSSPQLLELSKLAIQTQLKELIDDIQEYDDLKAGKILITEINSLKELPFTLIKARIANRLTQAELATRLNLKMQQIQRYEADNYSTASLKTLLKISEELNLSVNADVQIKSIDDPNLIDVKNYPFKQMLNRGWFGNFVGSLNDAVKDSKNLISHLFEQSGIFDFKYSLNRRSIRSDLQINEYALNAWYARVLYKAKEQHILAEFNRESINADWLKKLANLSEDENALKLVPNYLKNSGIRFIIEPALDGTLLDGAALLLEKKYPVIALTLRYDRLDNFWFVLFHEIAHIVLHLNGDLDAIFDDLDAKIEGIEKDADQFALDALIPSEIWRTSLVRFRPSDKTIINQAKALGIHPALVAGRIRRETGQYHQFTNLVGQNRVRSQFTFQTNN